MPGKKHDKGGKTEKKEEVKKEHFKGIVRLAGKDMSGELKLKRALVYVRGVGNSLAPSLTEIICKELNLQPDIAIGDLNHEQIEKIDSILFNAHNYMVMPYLLNRRADPLTGSNSQIIMGDLLFRQSQDIEGEKKLYTWRGYRHAYGQKVRGQRTRNTGRSGIAVGVLRKAIVEQQKKTAASAPAKGKPAEKKAE